MLDACIKSGNNKKAMEVYDQMKQDKIKLNTILYTTLIKGFTRDKNKVKALEIYQIMVDSKSSKPNNITFNTLIGCAVRCDDISTAKNLFNDM